jgi:hypothetical protein
VGGVGEQRYKQRQSDVAHVIIVHIHDSVLSSLKMKGIRLLYLFMRLHAYSYLKQCFKDLCMHLSIQVLATRYFCSHLETISV